MIRNFPGKKFAMGQHLEIVLILQAAEIERLTINLQEYRTKYINHKKDLSAYLKTKKIFYHFKIKQMSYST